VKNKFFACLFVCVLYQKKEGIEERKWERECVCFVCVWDREWERQREKEIRSYVPLFFTKKDRSKDQKSMMLLQRTLMLSRAFKSTITLQQTHWNGIINLPYVIMSGNILQKALVNQGLLICICSFDNSNRL
jgi:hypothetical protein